MVLNTVKKMIPIRASTLDFNINGYIALPEVTRASRNYISTMINGRFIKNYPLVKAIQEGYHTLLPIGRYPIAILNIEMDPILVDVNVHPAKLEVRISKEQELNELVATTIKSAFKQQELIPESFVQAKGKKDESQQTILNLDHIPFGSNRPETNNIQHSSQPVSFPIEKEESKPFSQGYGIDDRSFSTTEIVKENQQNEFTIEDEWEQEAKY